MCVGNQDKALCCGCTACKNICPTNAITMKEDKEGFLYPEVDKNLCIECGLCKKVCPFLNGQPKKERPKTYGAKIKDEEERRTSRSGAMFVAISDWILKQNGSVYGATFDENLQVFHNRATDKEVRDGMKGSKYVQSEIRDTFRQVKEDLKLRRAVLYTGTPCQIDGLRQYLKKEDTSCLYLCDLICHGVPSPKVYQDYLKFMEQKEEQEIIKFDFRDKSYGWSGHKETITFKDKTVTKEDYTKLFYSHYILRPCCYECPYTSIHRVSDITLADFWGIEKLRPEFQDEKGVSLVLINTEKGQSVWENVKDNLYWFETDIDQCMQPNLQRPTIRPENREEFWKEYTEKSFDCLLKKYAN